MKTKSRGADQSPASSSPTLEPSRARKSRATGTAPGISLSETLPAAGLSGSVSLDLPTDDRARYEISGEHARGGLGRIVNATDLRLGRVVAIKELLDNTEAMTRSFIREAMVTARLQHPGIVPIHDAGKWPSGEPYYSMPMLPGRSLKEAIEAADSIAARLDLVRHALAVADTLAYAHSQGVVHRDVKPANIMIGEYGETVLIDWGMALIEEREDSDLCATHRSSTDGRRLATGFDSSSSGIVGTPAYMSPEQAKGKTVDATADVYALGAVLYELLTGQAPYGGTCANDVLALVQDERPTPAEELAPSLPPELVAIVEKAMARSPIDRYPSAQELASDLRRFQAGQLVVAHRYSTSALLQRWIRRNKSAVVIALIAATIVVATGVVSVERVVEERNVAMQERSTAQIALAEASQRRRELTLLQAKSSLTLDPTATIAWLKEYDPRHDEMAAVQALVSEARARGVAKHVVRIPEQIWQVQYSPDGQTVAFVSRDGALHAVDLTTKSRRTLGNHPGIFRAMTFDRRGSRIATGGAAEGTVRIWNLRDGSFADLPPIGDAIVDLAFSAGGDKLLINAAHKSLKSIAVVWDVIRHKQLWSTQVESRRILLAASGNRIVSVGANNQAIAYDVEEGRERILGSTIDPAAPLALSNSGHVLLSHQASGLYLHDLSAALTTSNRVGDSALRAGTSLVVAEDQRFAAAFGRGPTVVYWDLTKGKPTELYGHKDTVYAARFLPDSRLVTASDDATVRIWGLRTTSRHVLLGHTDDVVAVSVSPDGETIASASLDGSLRIWPTRMGGSYAVTTDQPMWRLSKVGHTLASLAKDGTVSVWNISTRTGSVLGKGTFNTGILGDLIQRPVVSPDQKWVATTGNDNDLLLFRSDGSGQKSLRGLTASIRLAAFSPDGTKVVASGNDNRALLWDIDSERATEIADTGDVFMATFTPDGKHVALATSRGLIVREVESGANVDTPPETRKSALVGVLLSPDGNFVVGAGPQQAFVWDRIRNRVFAPEGSRQVLMAAFSADSTQLAAACADRRVRVWNLVTGKTTVLAGHSDMVFEVAFVDNNRVVSSSYDRTVRVWNLADQQSRVLWGHAGAAVGLAVLDNDQLAVADNGGAIRWWDITDHAPAMPREMAAQLPALTSARIQGDSPQSQFVVEHD